MKRRRNKKDGTQRWHRRPSDSCFNQLQDIVQNMFTYLMLSETISKVDAIMGPCKERERKRKRRCKCMYRNTIIHLSKNY